MNLFHWMFQLLALGYALLHLVGMVSSVHALLTARTSSAAIAWSISLLTFPVLAVPLYLLFGNSHFRGYVQGIRAGSLERSPKVQRLFDGLEPWLATSDLKPNQQKTFERLARFPMTRGNQLKLLIDGPATYQDIFEGIPRAQRYVLVQFFEVFEDGIGRRLRECMMERARAGLLVVFLFDRMGCLRLSEEYLQPLREAGVQCLPFLPSTRKDRFQMNFRNHRKVVIVDGRHGWTGGLNVGDAYVGLGPRGPWRDTHLRLSGPAVMGLQMVFLEDYYFLTGHLLDNLNWIPQANDGVGVDHNAVYISNGPADDLDVGVLFFLQCIECAQERLWMANPYFLPDPSVVDALQLAALRGVDVRIILPAKWDMVYMYLGAWTYLATLQRCGIKVYWFPHYAHQKVLLIDHQLASVGSSNLDNRSMRLNFEGNLVVEGKHFNDQIAAMLEQDMARSRLSDAGDLDKSLPFRLAARLSQLFSPIL